MRDFCFDFVHPLWSTFSLCISSKSKANLLLACWFCTSLVSLFFILKTSHSSNNSRLVLAIPLKGRAVDFAASAAKASELLDERSDAMATTLMSMKGAKTIGCTVVLERIIDKLRAREREAFKKSREVFFAPGVLREYYEYFHLNPY